MPKYTAPNQRTIQVHRERPTGDFLGIKNANWMDASKDLGAHALRLYLYLASNADGYELALSPAAITEAIGMARTTYRDQFKILLNKGYLVETSSNHFSFYERPQNQTTPAVLEKESAAYTCTNDVKVRPQEIQECTPYNTEIYNNDYNIYPKNNSINNESFNPKVANVNINEYMNEKGEFIF